MKRKIVCVIKDEKSANEMRNNLLDHDVSDFRLIPLGADYEQVIRQEVFLTAREFRITWLGGLIGALLGAVILTALTWSSLYAIILGRLLASGLSAAVFVGAGSGLAIGGLIAGLYAMSCVLAGNFTDRWLLVLFCEGKKEIESANKIVEKELRLC